MPSRASRPFILLAVVAVLIAAYYAYWRQAMQHFQAEVAALMVASPDTPVFISAATVDFGGFPYRLEARFSDAQIQRERADYTLKLATPLLVVNRQPWRKALLVGEARQATLTVTYPLFAGGGVVQVAADLLEFSHRAGRGSPALARMSLVAHKARVEPDSLPFAPFTAQTLEIHARQAPPVSAPQNRAADTGPTVLELVLTGAGVQFDTLSGPPLTVLLNMAVAMGPNADPLLGSLADWRDGGGTLLFNSVQVRGPVMIAQARATLAVDAAAFPVLAGVVDSRCPQSLQALLPTLTIDALPPASPSQKPLKKPLSLSFSYNENGATWGLADPIQTGKGDQNSHLPCPAGRQ